MAIWALRHLGMWLSGYLGIWVFGHSLGHLGMWVFIHLGMWLFGNFGIWPFGSFGIWEFGHLRVWVFVIWPSGQFPKYPPKNRAQVPICPNEYRNAQITTSPNGKIIKCPKAFGHLSNHLDICSFVHFCRLGIWAFIGTFYHLGICAFGHVFFGHARQKAKRLNA